MIGGLVEIYVDGFGLMHPPSEEDITLQELQEAVGGYIEVVRGWDDVTLKGQEWLCIVYCDEEGKLKRKPVNQWATNEWHQRTHTADVLVGKVAIVYGDAEYIDRHIKGEDEE